jgi:chromosome segregation ATPase
MTIRGLEDEIKLLRKQNNEIDKLWRCSDEKLRMTNEDLLKKGSRDMDLASRFSSRDRSTADGDNQALIAAESQIRSLKRQVQQAEADAESLRQQTSSLNSKIQDMEERKSYERTGTGSARSKSVDEKLDRKSREQEAAMQARISELERLLSQRDADLRALKAQLKDADSAQDEIRSLQKRLSEAEREIAQLRSALTGETDKLKERDRLLNLASNASDERAALEQRLAAMERERNSSQENQQKLMCSKDGEMSALVESKSQVEKELRECRQAISDKQAMLHGAQQKCLSLEADLKRQATDVVGPLQQQLADLKRRLELSQADVTTAEKALTAARQEVEKLKSELASRQAADAESLSRLCRIRELEAELRAEKQGSAEKQAALKARIDALEAKSKGSEKASGEESARLLREMEALKKQHAEEVALLKKRADEGAASVEAYAKQVDPTVQSNRSHVGMAQFVSASDILVAESLHGPPQEAKRDASAGLPCNRQSRVELGL